MPKDTKLPAVIFLSSSASLAFEVLLTRIFSISLWYHFAFMIISIAMLGFAASGTILSLLPRVRDNSRIASYTLLLGIAMSASFLLANRIPFDPVRLSWDRSQLLAVGLYYLTLALPFFCTGLIIATAFATTSERAGLLYGADLLGAGVGSLGVLLLLDAIPPDRAVFVLSALALAATWLSGGPSLKGAALILIGVDLAICLLHPPFARLRISPYKGLPAALRYPGAAPLATYHTPFAMIDTFRSPAVRYAPGLSLRYAEEFPEQIGFAVDGGEVSAITRGTVPGGLAFLDWLPATLPYEIGRRDAVLVLDPRGGLPVLMARRHGAARINCVESNPALLRVIRDDYGAFAGDIYGKDVWSGLGRSWLKGHGGRFAIIDISLQGSEPSAAFGIAEDYRFTVEAVKEYLSHLEEDGVLAVNLYILPPPRTELRLLATIVSALEELGIRDGSSHIAAVRSWGSICLVVKRSPLTPTEVERIRRFAAERWFDLLHVPGIRAEEQNRYIRMAGNDYPAAFASILDPARRSGFMEGYIFDIRPVRDDRPFFHYFLRLGKIREIYRAMGEKWEYFLEEGYLLPAVLLQVVALGAVLIIVPAFAQRARPANPAARIEALRLLPYFALLGIGYMFVEVVLVQKLILPLENPAYAVAAALATLLVSSGAGSLLSYRWPRLQSPAAAAAIAVLAVLYSIVLPAASTFVAPWPLPLKLFLLLGILLPLGLPMGIPFPTGLHLLGARAPQLIPWAWAINGCLSVLAPILAIMAAMAIGFSGVLWLGALAYFLAYLSLRGFKKTMGDGQ